MKDGGGKIPLTPTSQTHPGRLIPNQERTDGQYMLHKIITESISIF